ncbi:MAG: hypothetical protein ACRC4L_01680, partial [Mycoplasma sp.]
NSYKSIAKFLNQLILSKKITENDSMIINFTKIIEASCSETNQNKFKQILFSYDISNIKNFVNSKKDEEEKFVQKTLDLWTEEDFNEEKENQTKKTSTLEKNDNPASNENHTSSWKPNPTIRFKNEEEHNLFTQDFSFLIDENEECDEMHNKEIEEQ